MYTTEMFKGNFGPFPIHPSHPFQQKYFNLSLDNFASFLLSLKPLGLYEGGLASLTKNVVLKETVSEEKYDNLPYEVLL